LLRTCVGIYDPKRPSIYLLIPCQQSDKQQNIEIPILSSSTRALFPLNIHLLPLHYKDQGEKSLFAVILRNCVENMQNVLVNALVF
jgi:hypothetical protein